MFENILTLLSNISAWFTSIYNFLANTFNIIVDHWQNNHHAVVRITMVVVFFSLLPFILLGLDYIFAVILNILKFIYYLLENIFYFITKIFGFKIEQKAIYIKDGQKYKFIYNRKTQKLTLKSIKKIIQEEPPSEQNTHTIYEND
ncbi:hypothetical protein [Candidatus Phytoplasma pruni]|uniref:Uncharacterized protein n=1 Tax=Candidatus Phytoplasma pruni TaxID=479893 RepID=A0A851HJU6_9MOLU|nr:hypothetical protein [Candidatus Phytoplasma pruni]NWN45709.1 hypothetical protein [Candidatus Phytoplasma pruni]